MLRCECLNVLDIDEWDRRRTLVVQPVKPEDMPVIKMLIQNAACKNASVKFVRDKEEALHGCVSRHDNATVLSQCVVCAMVYLL